MDSHLLCPKAPDPPRRRTSHSLPHMAAGLSFRGGGKSTMARGDVPVPLPFSTHEPPKCIASAIAS